MNEWQNLVPTKLQALLMAGFSALFGWASYAIGGIDLSIKWLFAFVVMDYVTGTMAACRSGQWCSKKGFMGPLKKVSIFVIVAVCHGVDVVSGADFMRSGAIAAYGLTEVGSIFENINRLGYGHYLPQWIQKALKELQQKQEKKIEEVDENDKSSH